METTAVKSSSAPNESVKAQASSKKDIGDGFAELLECLFQNIQQPFLQNNPAGLASIQSSGENGSNTASDLTSLLGNFDSSSLMKLLNTVKQYTGIQLKGNSLDEDAKLLASLLSGTQSQGMSESDLLKLVLQNNQSAKGDESMDSILEALDNSDLSLDDILKPLNNENAKNPINVNQMQKMVDKIVQNLLTDSNTVESTTPSISADDVKNRLLQFIASLKPARSLSNGAENQLDRVINNSIDTAMNKIDILKIYTQTDNSSQTDYYPDNGNPTSTDSSNAANTDSKDDNTFLNLQNDKTGIDLLSRTVDNLKAASDEVPVIRSREDLMELTVNKFKSLKLPEITELKVKLRPRELGDITVKVVLERGQINGSINANSKEVANILQNQIENLKQELRNSGVNLNNIAVNSGTENNLDSNQSRSFFNQGEQKRNHRNFNEAFEETVQNENVDNDGFEIMA